MTGFTLLLKATGTWQGGVRIASVHSCLPRRVLSDHPHIFGEASKASLVPSVFLLFQCRLCAVGGEACRLGKGAFTRIAGTEPDFRIRVVMYGYHVHLAAQHILYVVFVSDHLNYVYRLSYVLDCSPVDNIKKAK